MLVKVVGWGLGLGGGNLCDRLMRSAEKGDWRWSWFGMEGIKQDNSGYRNNIKKLRS